MKTSVIEVRDMLSVLSVPGVEERIGNVPGVESVTVNFAAGSATVRYDETRLQATDIKAAVHQSGDESAGETQAKHASEHKPVDQRAVVPAPEAASASASTPEATVPKTSTDTPAVIDHKDHAVPGAQSPTPEPAMPKTSTDKPAAVSPPTAPVVEAAPGAKPSTPVTAVPKAAPLAPATRAAEAAPVAKSSSPATTESKADSWKVPALSLATTLGVAYISCAIFDLLFPPFGLLAALAPASPLPISGSPLGFLLGFAMFIVAGLVLGALYGIASQFWSNRLR